MSIEWRTWTGERVGARELEANAKAVAHDAREHAETWQKPPLRMRIVGDTLLVARKGPSDSVEIFEARIVRVGEEAVRGNEPPVTRESQVERLEKILSVLEEKRPGDARLVSADTIRDALVEVAGALVDVLKARAS